MNYAEVKQKLTEIESFLSEKIINPNLNTKEKLTRDAVRTALSNINILIEED